jgi:hypothetical protein
MKFGGQKQNPFKHVPPLKHGLEQNKNELSMVLQFLPI